MAWRSPNFVEGRGAALLWRGGSPRYNAGMHEHGHSFGNNLLIALPSLQDSQFERSVTLICQHDGDGAMGVVVNRPSEYTLGEVLQQMGIPSRSYSGWQVPVWKRSWCRLRASRTSRSMRW